MNKLKTLKYISGILLLLNIALIIFILSPKPGHRSGGLHEKQIHKQFKFDDDKMQKFKASRNQHKTKLEEKKKVLNELAIQYYLTDKKSNKQEILDKIIKNTISIYDANDIHINDIKALCDSKQMKQMEEFITGLIKKTDGQSPPPKKKK